MKTKLCKKCGIEKPLKKMCKLFVGVVIPVKVTKRWMNGEKVFVIEYKDLKDGLKKLRLQAKYIRANCRLSEGIFKVGCCILSTSDTYFFGCNQNFGFDKGVHAEEAAVINMLCDPSATSKTLIKSLYIYTEDPHFVFCGDCRYKTLLYTEDRKTRIFVDNGKIVSCYQIGDLLPHYPKR